MKNILIFVLCLVSLVSYSQQLTPKIRKDLEKHKKYVDVFRVSDSLMLEKTREINWLVMALSCDHEELAYITKIGLTKERIKITTDTIFARVGRLSKAYYRRNKIDHEDSMIRFDKEYERVRQVHADYLLRLDISISFMGQR